MDELLNKSVNELTEEEWKQVQQLKNKKKPSVPFHKATLDDCIRPDGLALKIHNINMTAPTIRIPNDFVAPTASAHLCETLDRIHKVWVLDNEKSCRIVIDAILTEVLLNESNEELLGFCEVKNDWEGPGFGYTGDVDYMLGTSKIKCVDTMDSCLLVVEAKYEWPAKSVAQTLAEAGCVLKKRLAAGKKTPVLAVLTNGTDFRFFAIDTDGIVYASGKKVLEPADDGTYNTSSSLSEILRWFTWFMTSIKCISPRASSEDLTAEMIDESLAQLRKCFVKKNPISSKKLKLRK